MEIKAESEGGVGLVLELLPVRIERSPFDENHPSQLLRDASLAPSLEIR